MMVLNRIFLLALSLLFAAGGAVAGHHQHEHMDHSEKNHVENSL